MKRRLSIARSLINEPELLLLDEPTTGLDPQARHVLWDRLYRLKQQGVTPGAHHPLHGRGRAAVRPAGGDGPGPDRRRGIAARADRAATPTREVLELRFGAGTQRPVRTAGRRHRRPARGAARPRARLRRRRRGRAGRGAPPRLASRRARSCAAASLEDVFLLLTGRSLVGLMRASRRHPGPLRVVSWHLAVFRRLWRLNLLSSFVQPMLYLLGLGVGVGALVDRNAGSTATLGGVLVRRVRRARAAQSPRRWRCARPRACGR